MCGWYDEDISKIGQQVPESDRRISGKREAGGKPARSRHCKQGAPGYAHVKTAWRPLVFGDWEGTISIFSTPVFRLFFSALCPPP